MRLASSYEFREKRGRLGAAMDRSNRRSPPPKFQRTIVVDRAGRRFVSLDEAERCRAFPGHKNFRDWVWTDGTHYWFQYSAAVDAVKGAVEVRTVSRNENDPPPALTPSVAEAAIIAEIDKRISHLRRVKIAGVDISGCTKNFAGKPVVAGSGQSNPTFRSIETEIYFTQLQEARDLLPSDVRDAINGYTVQAFGDLAELTGGEWPSEFLASLSSRDLRRVRRGEPATGTRRIGDPVSVAVRWTRNNRSSSRIETADPEAHYAASKVECERAHYQLAMALDSCLKECHPRTRARVLNSAKLSWKSITDAWLYRLRVELKL